MSRPVRVTVAIPTRNGGELFEQTLATVAHQRADGFSVELLICDSGSTDGTVKLARAHGAEVISISTEQFSHGATRNLLMERARGSHVAFLTQDAVPADSRWLERLLLGFSISDSVGLAFGPYLARTGASLMVRRELAQWFQCLSPDDSPRVDRLEPPERDLPPRDLLGPRGFFTDANGCVARAAWRQVPFRNIPYAEDHVLAHDMMRAGFAKVFVPDASVIHSHDYSLRQWLRRSFDEARAMHAVYGFEEQRNLRRALLHIWGSVGADVRFARAEGLGLDPSMVLRSLTHHLGRSAGTVLGAHAEDLPSPLVRRLSLERRG